MSARYIAVSIDAQFPSRKTVFSSAICRRIRVAALTSLVAPAFAIALPLAMPTGLHAQQVDVQPDLDKVNWWIEGQLNSPEFVRSGPGVNYYPTQRLEKGAIVTSVGKHGDWLVIVPPEGSFSYVKKAFVNLYGDGKSGKVSAAGLTVHTGSIVQPQMQWGVQGKLDVGQDVQILGEENEYYKIKPPANAYLFIDASAVTKVRAVAKPGDRRPDPPSMAENTTPQGAPSGPAQTQTPPRPAPGERAVARDTAVRNTSPATQPAFVFVAPSTRPSETSVKLQQLETDFAAASAKPLVEQPIDALLAGYESLASSSSVPEPTRKIADSRANALKIRAQTLSQFLAYQKDQQERDDRLKSQEVERGEIQDRLSKTDVKLYSAVGTLRTSSLQFGSAQSPGTILYRLTDPATERTVVYIRSADPKFSQLVGQFVGVRGAVKDEAQLNLKVITPTATDVVDPARVNAGVLAEIVPASLEAKGTPQK